VERTWIWLVGTLGIVCAGCGQATGNDGEKPDRKEVVDPAITIADELVRELETQVGLKAEKGPADWSSRERLCEQVFGQSDAARIFGTEDLGGGLKKKRGNPIAGATKCQWTAPKTGSAQIVVTVTIDCRPGSLTVDTWRSAMRSMAQDKPENYRDIDLGLGGGHLAATVMNLPSFQVNYVHDLGSSAQSTWWRPSAPRITPTPSPATSTNA
jgi:hypothetical protein